MFGVEFTSMLKDVERNIKKENKRLLRKAADVVYKEAKSILNHPTGDTPQELTGNLKRGMKKVVKGNYAKVGNVAPHAWLVEHGHDVIRNRIKVGEARPKPFLSKAFENTKDKVKEILSEKRNI
jgi:HK97 gp10 family phage protein